jgi:hypothetical protein
VLLQGQLLASILQEIRPLQGQVLMQVPEAVRAGLVRHVKPEGGDGIRIRVERSVARLPARVCHAPLHGLAFPLLSPSTRGTLREKRLETYPVKPS